MSKVDVEKLTLDESKEAFVELIAFIPNHLVRELIVENMQVDELEELEMDCNEKVRELREEENDEEDED